MQLLLLRYEHNNIILVLGIIEGDKASRWKNT